VTLSEPESIVTVGGATQYQWASSPASTLPWAKTCSGVGTGTSASVHGPGRLMKEHPQYPAGLLSFQPSMFWDVSICMW